jgi:hypothetical protein
MEPFFDRPTVAAQSAHNLIEIKAFNFASLIFEDSIDLVTERECSGSSALEPEC